MDPEVVVLATGPVPGQLALSYVMTRRRTGDAAVLHLVGELDLATAPDLARALTILVEHGRTDLHLDLGRLVFCDLAGLSALEDARRRSLAAGGSLALIGPSPFLVQVARWCGMADLVACVVPGEDESPPPDDHPRLRT